MATITQAQVQIYIYTGTFGSIPSTPQYTLVKDKLSSETIISFEVAELVKDYIDINFTGDYDTIEQSAWVHFKITRSFDNDTTDTLTRDVIAFTGYGEFEDGINPKLKNGFLMSNTNVYVDVNDVAYLPFYRSNEKDSAFKVEYFKGSTSLGTEIISSAVQRLTADTTDIKADTTAFRADVTKRRSSNSKTFKKHSRVPNTTTKAVLTLADGSTDTRTIYRIEECKYTPCKISFINKFGVIQDLFFFKRKNYSFESERDEYHKSILSRDTSTTYDEFGHSKKTIDITATKRFIANTGYITEDHNEVIKQLMVTEYCWVKEYVTDKLTLVPIMPITTSFVEKTEVTDKLLNFTVEFEYANNFIQNIR